MVRGKVDHQLVVNLYAKTDTFCRQLGRINRQIDTLSRKLVPPKGPSSFSWEDLHGQSLRTVELSSKGLIRPSFWGGLMYRIQEWTGA